MSTPIRAPGSYRGLTTKQADLLSFIRVRQDEGQTPSFEEMKEALDLKSKSGVHRLIAALQERGYITRMPNRARALEAHAEPVRIVSANDHDAVKQALKRAHTNLILTELQRRGFFFRLAV